MTKQQQEYIKQQLESLMKDYHVEDCQPFQNLWKLASEERHPEGDQSLLSNLSIYSWERLISMRDEARDKSFMMNDLVLKDALDTVYDRINSEIERRLLALLPQEK